jgi:hypothetical protein
VKNYDLEKMKQKRMAKLVEPQLIIEEQKQPKRKKREVQLEPTIIEELEMETSFTFTKKNAELEPNQMPKLDDTL